MFSHRARQPASSRPPRTSFFSPAEQAQYVNQMLGGGSDRDIEEAITNLAEYSASPPAPPPGSGVRVPDYFPDSNAAQVKRQAQLAATDALFDQAGLLTGP